MHFSPAVKAWLLLLTLVMSSGIAVGVTSFLGGAHWGVSLLLGLGTAATNVYHALAETPKDKIANAKDHESISNNSAL